MSNEFDIEGNRSYRTRETSSWFYKKSSILHYSIRKSEAILIKLYHNECGHKISDKFDYALDQTSMSRVVCPSTRKMLYSTLFTV